MRACRTFFVTAWLFTGNALRYKRLNQGLVLTSKPDNFGADQRMSTLKALHGFVSGRVQGVFFRGETQKKAKLLGLAGWVKNTSDGQVEVFIAGQQVAVATMVEWLHSGPTMARVKAVELDEVDWEVPLEFVIIR